MNPDRGLYNTWKFVSKHNPPRVGSQWPNPPLIKGQVPVSKLSEQSPLQNLFGRLVLYQVDDDVL